MNYKPGDRVRISVNYNWAQGASGTIDNPPDFARELARGDSPGKIIDVWFRELQGRLRYIGYGSMNHITILMVMDHIKDRK
jgi:hypothetical protein